MDKVRKLLEYVSNNNEFYMNMIKEYAISDPQDITQYPVLTRNQIQKSRYDMFSRGYRTKYFAQLLLRRSSSGTSGVPINVYWDQNDWCISNVSLWRRRFSYYGISPSDKYIKFELNAFGIAGKDDNIYCTTIGSDNILSINVSLLHSEAGYLNLVKVINEFNPKWLYIQPSILSRLIFFYKKYSLMKPLGLTYIESIGELLSNDLKQEAINFFDVPVVNMYGSEEMNAIAYECPNHKLHILDDNVLVEIQQDKEIKKSGKGKAIISNLNNFCMPLIRYDQEDIVVVSKGNKCSCGCNSTTIDLVVGRSREFITFDDGTEINSFLLTDIMAEVNNQYDGAIKEYKYIFSYLNLTMDCEIKLGEEEQGWFINIKESIEKIFRQKMGHNLKFNLNIKMINDFQIGSKRKILEIR